MRSAPGLAICALLAGVVQAGDGVPPRPSSADYPVSQDCTMGTIAATPVPPDLAKKIFPTEVNKNYFVVEVAVYPKDGQTVYLDSFDFALKVGADGLSHPRTPQEIASIWAEENAPQPPHKVDVIAETGVVYNSGNDPVGGRSRGVGTYSGVAVSSGQPPPPFPGDPHAVEAQVGARALPEGPAVHPVAGYLYFPLTSKKNRKAAMELQYLKDGELVSLPLPTR